MKGWEGGEGERGEGKMLSESGQGATHTCMGGWNRHTACYKRIQRQWRLVDSSQLSWVVFSLACLSAAAKRFVGRSFLR